MVAVAVIAILITFPDRAIAATGRTAAVGAGVAVELVAVIAGLTEFGLDDAVATKDQFAGPCAAVLGRGIAIIAALIALFAFSDVGAHHRIAANRHRTGILSGVFFESIAVIAGLIADRSLG